VNNILRILLIFIIFSGCSLNKNSNFWTNKKIKPEEQDNSKEIFAKEKLLDVEINPNLKISLYAKPIDKSFINNNDNNNGRVNYNGELKNISKFKYSKIINFDQYEPEILFHKENIIFFDNKGAIFKFNDESKLVWKKNHYSKLEKKQKPILFFSNNNKILIVGDNIAKYYALDIESGKLIWMKNSIAPFNSQIKIYKDKFFIIDFQNILRCYSIKDGKEIWNRKTQNSLISSQKKLSLVILKNKLYFNNTLGDITAVNLNDGELLWQSPTQSSLSTSENFFLKTSDLIADQSALYFSNNKNEFFSFDINSGAINWKQKINSTLRPTLIDNYIFTVSIEGYLFVIEKNSGKIVRSTNIFKNFKPKKRIKIKPSGFIVGKDNIYLTTTNGKLLIIDIKNGQTKSILKIDREKILRPSVSNKSLYIAKDNSIIKLN